MKKVAMKHGGMKAAPPPMSGGSTAKGPSPAKSAGASAAVPLSAPKAVGSFGHKTQTLQSLATDRGAFKLKG